MTAQELISCYLDLFAGRPDTYAIRTEWTIKNAEGVEQQKAAYLPSTYDGHKDTTKARVAEVVRGVGAATYGPEAVAAHLRGQEFLGVYPLHADSTVKFAALDFDGDDPDQAWAEAQRQYATLVHEAGLPCYMETSRSGNGYHIWVFFDGPVNAGTVRRAIKPFINKTECWDRMFPNQNSVTEHRPLGNLIALPLSGPKVREGKNTFVDPETREPIADIRRFLAGIERASVAQIEKLAAEAPEMPEEREITIRSGPAEGNLWGIDKLLDPRFGCSWVRWFMECPEDVDEPAWYALACNLAQLRGGREAFHHISAFDKRRYEVRGTDAKFDQAIEKNAPHSCEYIRDNLNGPGCDCDRRFPGRVRRPYDLASIPVFDLIESVVADAAVEHALDGFDHVAQWAQEVEKDPLIGQGYPYGYKALDEYTGLRDATLNIFAARPSIGKAQPLDAEVLTPKGFRPMGTMKVGDAVIGRDGKAHTVLGVYPQGEKPIFRVTFNDGTETECCDEHLWLTQTYRDTKTGREGTVKSLAEIRETLRYGKEARYNHAVPLVAPVEFDQCEGEHLGMFRQRLLHPYVMGAYLGDGTSWGTMRFHNPEADVRAKFASLLPETDELVEEGPVTCRVRRKRRNHEPSTALQHLGQYPIFGACAEDKAIPIDYQYAPVADRIALLQGLFDTDGHVYGPGVEFSTSSFWLAHDVALVVRSLGGTVTSSDRVPTFKYKHEVREGQRAYRLFVQFENGIVPVSSAKHLARWTTRQRTQRKWITSVEPVGVKPAQCIKVSAPDSLYVTDDFIVTHNTAFSLDVAYRAADSNVPVYYFSLEMSREQLWRRLLCRAAGVSPTKLVKGELTPEDWAKIRATQADLRGRERFPFFVEDSTRDIRKIMDIAWRLKEEHGHGIVVIDYLGLLSWHKGEKEYDATTRNSKESKLLAKATGMPVLELVQLNRTGDDTSVGAEVSDSMLRSSGQIEQDADVILFMLGERGPGIKEREIVIQKERDREAGHRILMEFNPYLMQFGAQGAWFTLDNHLAITQPVSGADDHTLAWGFEDGEQRAADIERELEPTLAAPRDVRAFGFGEMTETVIEGVRADLLALETLG